MVAAQIKKHAVRANERSQSANAITHELFSLNNAKLTLYRLSSNLTSATNQAHLTKANLVRMHPPIPKILTCVINSLKQLKSRASW
jgi:hypothetical protein